MQELYLLSPDIKDAINVFLKVPRIMHVRLKLVGEKKKAVRKVYPKKMRRPDTVALSSAQTLALSRIQDENLRAVLTDFWARCTLFQEKKA
jgi:fructose 1,6-bisphosphatase